MVTGLFILGGWLALLTYRQEGFWTGNAALWTRNAQTVRAHVNARQADIDSGHIDEAINECGWLLRALETGVPVTLTRIQRRDIPRICLHASPR